MANFLGKEAEMLDVCVKIFFLSDLLRSQYLLEILNTSIAVKYIKNVRKMDVSKNPYDGEHPFLSVMKEGCKTSCLKILIFG